MADALMADALWGELAGQDSAVETLQAAARAADQIVRGIDAPTGAMTHAWLFTGPPGSGRSVAAQAFAAALQCPNGGCGQCAACHTALTGTHADGDLDLVAKQASLAFEVPALLGLTGRLVELPDGTYLSSTLRGDGWVSIGAGAAQLPSGQPLAQLATLRTLLTDLVDAATKLDDASCGDGRCYQVRIWLTSEQARGLVPAPSADATAQPTPPISHTPIAIMSAAKATGSAWKFPPDRAAPSSAKISGLSVTPFASVPSVWAAWIRRSRTAPMTWG